MSMSGAQDGLKSEGIIFLVESRITMQSSSVHSDDVYMDIIQQGSLNQIMITKGGMGQPPLKFRSLFWHVVGRQSQT